MNSEMMAKLRGLIVEAATGECNVTAEGKSCPVHGMEECAGYMTEMAPAGISDELAAKKIAAKIMGTPDLNIPKIKQYVTKYLSMVGKAPTDVTHLAALVHTELENKGVMESDTKPDFPDLDGDGNRTEPMKDAAKDAKAGKKSTAKKGGMSAKQAKYFGKKTAVKEAAAFSPELQALMQKYGVDAGDSAAPGAAPVVTDNVDEDVHVTVDGPEAQEMINRLMALAGNPDDYAASHADMPAHDDHAEHADMCDDCGSAECTCDDISTSSSGLIDLSMEEDIDNDFGHTAQSDMGEPVDPDTYTYKAPVGDQRMVKGIMGDNPLIKENAGQLHVKLKKDYKSYVVEAELARSNAGDASPLTADNRDKFEVDPFLNDEPVTDGSHSPLSTIKRQSVNK